MIFLIRSTYMHIRELKQAVKAMAGNKQLNFSWLKDTTNNILPTHALETLSKLGRRRRDDMLNGLNLYERFLQI